MANEREKLVEAIGRGICKSGKFECGQGCCAPICMEMLGEARRGCSHVIRVHGKLVRAILAAIESLGLRIVPVELTMGMYDAACSQIRAGEGPCDIWQAALAASPYAKKEG